MNRREFLTAAGSVGAGIVISGHRAFAKTSATSLYVKGLVIVDFDDADYLKLGFPKAPGHKATLAVTPQNGNVLTMTIKGDGTVSARTAASAKPKIAVPEIVRLKEFYGDAIKSKVDDCPSVISIPYSAVTAISTAEVSASRYAFLRSDTGEEVNSFRQRQVAETIRIDLLSTGTFKLEGSKVSIPLELAKEIRIEHAPEEAGNMDAYADHFHHYFAYVERPAALDFDVVPKRLTRSAAPAPRAGHNFMAWGEWPYCFVISIH